MMTAVIPARGGSRRLKNKNITLFADSNLLVHKIRQLKHVPSVDRIVVSSDSEEMLQMAEDEGVIAHRRDPAYADEVSKTFGETIWHICRNVEGDHVAWAQCTSPLVLPEQYEEAIALYYKLLEEGQHDSLATVEPFQRHVWDDNGPVNYKRGRDHALSQDLPRWYFVTGVFIAPRLKMIDWYHNMGARPYMHPLPRINLVDIDDELDLATARLWWDIIVSKQRAVARATTSPALKSSS